jgi:hypothetical protein
MVFFEVHCGLCGRSLLQNRPTTRTAQMSECETPATRNLRALAVVTFLPAFPLCLVHGIVTSQPVPAVGLVPLAFSTGTSVFLLVRGAHQRFAGSTAARHGIHASRHRLPADRGPLVEEGNSDHDPTIQMPPQRPVLVCAVDIVLATALMVVLVCTWVHNRREYSAPDAMLAAYATVPLLVNL